MKAITLLNKSVILSTKFNTANIEGRKRKMIISKEDFITEMAKRNGVTKKASREYLNLVLKTFFELLVEGHVIRFHELFSATIITASATNTSANSPKVNAKERMEQPPYKRFSIRLSKKLKKEINKIMKDDKEN